MNPHSNLIESTFGKQESIILNKADFFTKYKELFEYEEEGNEYTTSDYLSELGELCNQYEMTSKDIEKILDLNTSFDPNDLLKTILEETIDNESTLSYQDLVLILSDIKADFQGKHFEIFNGNHKGRWWVQVGTERPDCDDPSKFEIGKSGKAYVSSHSTDDEIVKKVFGLCMAYVEHEMREGYYYKGKRIFGPHITLEALMEVADKTQGRL